jgi:hypothetical protein
MFMTVLRLIKKARDNILEMGQTGAGLDSADDIEPESALAKKWGEHSSLVKVVQILN